MAAPCSKALRQKYEAVALMLSFTG